MESPVNRLYPSEFIHPKVAAEKNRVQKAGRGEKAIKEVTADQMVAEGHLTVVCRREVVAIRSGQLSQVLLSNGIQTRMILGRVDNIWARCGV